MEEQRRMEFVLFPPTFPFTATNPKTTVASFFIDRTNRPSLTREITTFVYLSVRPIIRIRSRLNRFLLGLRNLEIDGDKAPRFFDLISKVDNRSIGEFVSSISDYSRGNVPRFGGVPKRLIANAFAILYSVAKGEVEICKI